MHLAAEYGHFDVVKFLIDKGADVNLRDQYGMSPLDHATRNDHLHVAEYLTMQEANVNSIEENTSMQPEGLTDNVQNMVSVNNSMPISSPDSMIVEPVNREPLSSLNGITVESESKRRKSH